jgi:hypothetical protein
LGTWQLDVEVQCRGPGAARAVRRWRAQARPRGARAPWGRGLRGGVCAVRPRPLLPPLPRQASCRRLCAVRLRLHVATMPGRGPGDTCHLPLLAHFPLGLLASFEAPIWGPAGRKRPDAPGPGHALPRPFSSIQWAHCQPRVALGCGYSAGSAGHCANDELNVSL